MKKIPICSLSLIVEQRRQDVINRRAVVTGLIACPAIVRFESLMKIVPVRLFEPNPCASIPIRPGMIHVDYNDFRDPVFDEMVRLTQWHGLLMA